MNAMSAPFAFSPMEKAISAMYNMGHEIDKFLDKHIQEMKKSDNPTVERSGRVLEAAKYGFGIGYTSSIIIIAAGQLLLGNPLTTVVVTAAQAVTLSNPVAMTCAALGALMYGYAALSQKERDELLLKLSNGLEVGIEFIKSVIKFVIKAANDFLGSEYVVAIKSFIKDKAIVFGKRLGQVTGSYKDKAADVVQSLEKGAGDLVDTIRTEAENVSRGASHTVEQGKRKVKKVAMDVLDQNGDGRLTLDDVSEVPKKVARKVRSNKQKSVADLTPGNT